MQSHVRIEYTENISTNRIYLHFSFETEEEAEKNFIKLKKMELLVEKEGNRVVLTPAVDSKHIQFNFLIKNNFLDFVKFYRDLNISMKSIIISDDINKNSSFLKTNNILPLSSKPRLRTDDYINSATLFRNDFINRNLSFERRVNTTSQYTNLIFGIFILKEMTEKYLPYDLFKYISQILFLKNIHALSNFNLDNLLAINKQFPLIDTKKYGCGMEKIPCRIEHGERGGWNYGFYLICSDEKSAEKLQQKIKKTTRLVTQKNNNELTISPNMGGRYGDPGVLKVNDTSWMKQGYEDYVLLIQNTNHAYDLLELIEFLPHTKNNIVNQICEDLSAIYFPKEYLRERKPMEVINIYKESDDTSNELTALEKKSSPIIMECYSEVAAENIYHKEFVQPLIIIFANGFTPGGYYWTNKNCNAQEESILAKTENIEEKLPPKYGKGLIEDYLGINIISNATIIHNSKKTRAHLAFVAMPNLGAPNPELNTPTENFVDRKAYLKHVISLVILQFHAAKRLGQFMITGRQGCGVFQNDDEDISAIIRCVNELKIFEDVQIVYALGRNCKKNLGNSQRTLYEIYNNPDSFTCNIVKECINEIKIETNIFEMKTVAEYMRDNYLLQMKISTYVYGIKNIISYLADEGTVSRLKAAWHGFFENETGLNDEKIKGYKIFAMNDLISLMLEYLPQGKEPIFILDDFLSAKSSCPNFTNEELIFLGRDGNKAESTETSKMLDALFKIIRSEKRENRLFSFQ